MSVKTAPGKAPRQKKTAAKKTTVTSRSGRPQSTRRGGSQPAAGTGSVRQGAATTGSPAADGLGQVDPQELRCRWENARGVIREAVGAEEEHDPRIWERGVYQLWLWLVIERLVVRRDEIEVSELSVISKMLHDQRKLSLEEAKQQQKAGDGHDGRDGGAASGAATAARLPEHFGEIVRQIYGTNFQDDGARAEAGTADVHG